MKKNLNFRTRLWLRIILLLFGLLLNISVLNSYRNVRSDFVQEYIAANSLRQGGSIYGEDFQKLGIEMLGFTDEYHNLHPPLNAWMFLPLSFFSYQTAYVVFGILSICFLFLINQFIVRGLGLSDEWFLNLMCFTLLWYPVCACLALGNTSIIIATCLIIGWYCLRFEKAYFAGFLFAVATLMKLFPGLVLLYLFMMKNWRAFFAMVFFIVLGLLLTTFIVGVDDMWEYSIIMIRRDVEDYRGYVLNHSIAGIVTRAFGKVTGWTEPLINIPRMNSLMIIFLDSAVLIYTIIKIKAMSMKQKHTDYAFALTLAAMLLLSPITWNHIFPVLILPIGLFLQEHMDDSSSRRLKLLLFILVCLSFPDVPIARGLMAIHHPFRMPWYSMLLTLAPGIGLFLLWIELTRRGDTCRC